MATKLKKCPFCGASAVMRCDERSEAFHVECLTPHCYGHGTTARFSNSKAASVAWNMREVFDDGKPLTNYCPNCGADMREVQDG